MKFEAELNFILDINEKFKKCDKENASDIYFEVLHASLAKIISAYTEEQYKKLPLPFRETIEKLEREILDCCSMTYVENYDLYVKEEGRFYKDESTDKTKMKTKCKQTIGFVVDADEGLNV